MNLQKPFIEMFKLKVPAPILQAQKQQTVTHPIELVVFCFVICHDLIPVLRNKFLV